MATTLLQTVAVEAPRRGLLEITADVQRALEASVGVLSAAAPAGDGLLHVWLRHTSASLIVQENADPAVAADLEAWLDRWVPDGDPTYQHRAEGPDDMPAHIKGAITATEILLPVRGWRLALGSWQGLFLWEHRTRPRARELTLTWL